MTITKEIDLVRFDGNDSTTVFPYAFQVDIATDMLVVLAVVATGAETVLVNGVDYSVTGIGEGEDGGNVTYPLAGDPLAAGETLTVYRSSSLLQSHDLTDQGPYTAATQEAALDKLVMQIQRLQSELDRTFKVPVSSGTAPASLNVFTDLWDSVNLFLNKTTYPNNSMTMDSATGEYVFNIDGVEVFRITASGFSIPGQFNVKSYGAVGDGVTDDTVAIQAAIDAVTAGLTGETYPSKPIVGNRILGGDTLIFPAGTYLTTGLTTNSCIKFKGIGSAASILRVTGISSVGITSAKTDGVFAVSRIMFEDIRIESNGDATQTGILLVDADDCEMKNVTITGFDSYGLHLQKAQYGNFTNLTVDDCGTGVYLDIGGGGFGCNNNTFDRLGIYGCGTGFDIIDGVANWLYAATIQNCSVVGLNIQASSINFNVIGGHFEFQQTVFDIANAGRNTTLQDVFFVVNASDTSRKVQNTGTGVMRFIGCTTQGSEPQTVGSSRAIIETTTGLCDIIGCKFGATLTGDEYVSDSNGSNSAVKGYSLVRDIVFSADRSNHELRKEMHATADKGMSTKIIGDATPRFWVDGGGVIYLEDGSGTGITLRYGTGDPEGVVTADVGSFFLRGDGGSGSTIYTKETGAGNTGWDSLVSTNNPSLNLDELSVNHTSPATAMAEFAAIDIQVDAAAIDPTSEVHFINMAVAGTPGAGEKISGIGTHGAVSPIHQHVGTFVTPDQAEYAARFPDGGAWTDGIDGETVFAANDDAIYIGAVDMFDDLEVILSTFASQDEFLIFEYARGPVIAWIAFTPSDGTNGFRQNGIIDWDSAALTNWKSDSDPGAAEGSAGYYIRIRRTRNTVITDPIVTTIKTLNPTEYGWDKDGNLTINSLKSNDGVYNVPGSYPTIQAGYNAAGAAGGGLVFIAPGTYDERILANLDNVTIQGSGMGVTIIDEVANSGIPIGITGTNNTIRDLTCSTDSGGGGAWSVISIGANGTLIENVEIAESDNRGIDIGASSRSITIRNCILGSVGGTIDDIGITAGSATSFITIQGVSTYGTISGTYALNVSSDNGVVSGNLFASGATGAINLTSNSSETTVVGNQCTGSITDGGTNNLVAANNV